MAVREFSGSENVRLSIGGLATVTHGTFAALYKVDNTAATRVLMAFLDSGFNLLWAPFVINDADALQWWATGDVAAPTSPQAVWVLAVVRKATGTATPRYSIYNLNTTTWTHGDASGTMVNGTAPTSGYINTSTTGSASEAFDGRLAVTAAWLNTVKWSADGTGDSQIETAGLHTSLANWVTAAPDSLWPWNPTVVAGIADIIGTSEQNAINGTTLVEGDDPPGFSFTGGGGPSSTLTFLRPMATPRTI